jgi:hypothetical protein
VEGRDGAARGADRLGAGRALGVERDGGDTDRDGARDGDTSRLGARRSRLPLPDRLVLPEPTAPCTSRRREPLASERGCASLMRRGVISRIPVRLVDRSAWEPPGGVAAAGIGSRRPPSAGVRDAAVVEPAGASAARRRPLMEGSVEGSAGVPAGRRLASSEPTAWRGVPVLAGEATAVRRPVAAVPVGADAKLVALPVVRRRAVTAPPLRPYDLNAYEPHAPLLAPE